MKTWRAVVDGKHEFMIEARTSAGACEIASQRYPDAKLIHIFSTEVSPC